MRNLWWIALLAAGISLAQERQPGAGINFYSRDAEIATGRNMARQFRGNTSPLGNETVADYVNRVGAKLAAQLPGGWPYEFEIIRQNTDGETHEPAAFPGGPIFVSAELIAAARNEAEFAAMLAHAMAHVAARHWTKNATRLDLIQASAIPPATNTLQGPTAMPLGLIQFQRSFERQADYLAVKTMAAAGYDPKGLLSYLEREQPLRPTVPRVFDLLPPREERVKAIGSEIAKLPARTYETGDEFSVIQAQITAH